MNELPFEIRRDQPGDEDAIRDVTSMAFETSELGHNGEAGLVEKLRAEGAASISLVALCGDRIVGHILFSPATIEWTGRRCHGLGLAPVSVLPEFQRRGIGARLVEAGLETAMTMPAEFVIVLGHPDYYPRFGFAPASLSNIVCEFNDVPDEAFLIRWRSEPASTEGSGIAKYHPAFCSFE
jgi:putative acetyltransferase